MPAHLLQEEVSFPAMAPRPRVRRRWPGFWVTRWRSGDLRGGHNHLLRVVLLSFVGNVNCNLGTWFPNFCFLSFKEKPGHATTFMYICLRVFLCVFFGVCFTPSHCPFTLRFHGLRNLSTQLLPFFPFGVDPTFSSPGNWGRVCANTPSFSQLDESVKWPPPPRVVFSLLTLSFLSPPDV